MYNIKAYNYNSRDKKTFGIHCIRRRAFGLHSIHVSHLYVIYCMHVNDWWASEWEWEREGKHVRINIMYYQEESVSK